MGVPADSMVVKEEEEEEGRMAEQEAEADRVVAVEQEEAEEGSKKADGCMEEEVGRSVGDHRGQPCRPWEEACSICTICV